MPCICDSMEPAAGKGNGDEMADFGDMSSQGLAVWPLFFFGEAAANGLK